MQAHGFRVSFTPLLEVLFTFPSRYWFAIGLSVVFSLAGWSPPVPAEFLVFRGTQVPAGLLLSISHTGLSPSTAALSFAFRYGSDSALAPVLQPRARRCHRPGLGSCAFARHYLRNHCYFLFLRVLRCFSSPRSPRALRRGVGIAPDGFPHSDIRGSGGHLPLTAAFRSLSRPSSPPRATGIPHAPLSAFLFVSPFCKTFSLYFSCSILTREIASLLQFWVLISLCVSIMSMISFPFPWRITDSNR